MSVTRYDISGSDEEMLEFDDGDFVRYSDYENLVVALHHIHRSTNIESAQDIAEAALLSAGEEL